MAIYSYDIVSTLQALGMMKYWKGKHIVLKKQVWHEWDDEMMIRLDYRPVTDSCHPCNNYYTFRMFLMSTRSVFVAVVLFQKSMKVAYVGCHSYPHKPTIHPKCKLLYSLPNTENNYLNCNCCHYFISQSMFNWPNYLFCICSVFSLVYKINNSSDMLIKIHVFLIHIIAILMAESNETNESPIYKNLFTLSWRPSR